MSDAIGQTGMASDGRKAFVIAECVSIGLLARGPIFWRAAVRARTLDIFRSKGDMPLSTHVGTALMWTARR